MSTADTLTISNVVIDPNRCRWCHGYHTGVCSLVKSYEYHPDGTLKRVEFHGISLSVRQGNDRD